MKSYGFMGSPVMALDNKGRLTVPAEFKDVVVSAVRGQLILCKSPGRFLYLFPESLWPQVEQKLLDLPEDDNTEAVQRMFIGSATRAPLDSGGRILIPQSLRDFASLRKDVTFMGKRNYFELWDSETLARQELELWEGTKVKGSFKALKFSDLVLPEVEQ